MDRIWAPWRIQFILGEKQPAKDPDKPGVCILCSKPAENNDETNYILERGERCFTILNLYPYNNGHLMVVPHKHTGELEAIDGDTLREMMETTARMLALLKKTMQPHGFNVGMNIGLVAGAGIKDHVHLHIVPRWNGDSNFMPVLGETKVISEHIDASYRRLRDALESIVHE